MKKSIKTILLFVMISALLLLCTTSTFAETGDSQALAKSVLYGNNYSKTEFGYDVRHSEPVIVKINPDNPDEVIDDYYGHCPKQKFIDRLIEYTNKDIAKVKHYSSEPIYITKLNRWGTINDCTIFDEPKIRGCTECPGRALERAKGTFYQDYVYDYWMQYNEEYAVGTGHNIPSVEKFFAAEGITLKAVTPKPAPAPTPVPTTPPKAVEKINEIKSKTDVKNTLIVINADGYYTIAVNGEIVKFPDLQPRMHLDRVFIPVRAVAETFNCDVNWDGRISATIINGNDRLITLAIGNDIMTVNGVDTKMDVEPVLIDERTCVPIRYIAEALGLTVKYEKV